MGIRINKTLGWGVEIEKSDYSSTINEDYADKDFKDYLDYVANIEYEDEIEKIRSGSEKALIRANDLDVNQVSPHDIVNIIEEEYNDNSKMAIIIVPVSEATTWNRFDDPIDYYEAKTPNNTLRYLKGGIFPWEGSYMDKRTGKPLRGKVFENAMFLKEISSIENKSSILNEYAVKCGFNDFNDYQENVVPDVPLPVRNVISYLKPFNDDSIVKELLPMLATYWA